MFVFRKQFEDVLKSVINLESQLASVQTHLAMMYELIELNRIEGYERYTCRTEGFYDAKTNKLIDANNLVNELDRQKKSKRKKA